MSDARERILAKVRKGIGRDMPTMASEARKALDGGVGSELPPRPLWTEDPVDRFLDRFAAAAGTFSRVSSTSGAAEAISAYLRERKLEPVLRVAGHPLLEKIDWPGDLRIELDSPVADAVVSVSVAEAGLAETGTLVMYSGPQSPTEMNFLPEYHIVLLKRQDIVGYMEDVWNRMRPWEGFPPRVLNFITGPSRTADVEQTLQLGAHGPRSLHLVLLEG